MKKLITSFLKYGWEQDSTHIYFKLWVEGRAYYSAILVDEKMSFEEYSFCEDDGWYRKPLTKIDCEDLFAIEAVLFYLAPDSTIH